MKNNCKLLILCSIISALLTMYSSANAVTPTCHLAALSPEKLAMVGLNSSTYYGSSFSNLEKSHTDSQCIAAAVLSLGFYCTIEDCCPKIYDNFNISLTQPQWWSNKNTLLTQYIDGNEYIFAAKTNPPPSTSGGAAVLVFDALGSEFLGTPDFVNLMQAHVSIRIYHTATTPWTVAPLSGLGEATVRINRALFNLAQQCTAKSDNGCSVLTGPESNGWTCVPGE